MDLQQSFSQQDATIISLLEALGRERALTDDESLLLERTINREGCRNQRTRWTPREERQLLTMTKLGKSRRQIAQTVGRSYWSVRTKINQLGKKGKVRASRDCEYEVAHG